MEGRRKTGEFPEFPNWKKKHPTRPSSSKMENDGESSPSEMEEEDARRRPSSEMEEEGTLLLKKKREGVSSLHLPPLLNEEAPHPVDTLSFFIDFNGRNPPTVTHQMHRVTVRNGKPQFFDSPELAKARADLCAHLEQHSPDAPFEGPLALSVIWLFKDSRGREGWRDTKPDTDNLEKLLKDCMTRARFWIDDAQVCEEHVFKRWSKTPGIAISITLL